MSIPNTWNSIFSDSMMTVTAVDRLVHHGVILEIKSDNYPRQAATAPDDAAQQGANFTGGCKAPSADK
jgi:hypothetical protein